MTRAAAFALLAAFNTGAQPVPPARQDEIVRGAVTSWVKNTGIAIASDAESLIYSQRRDAAPRLDPVLAAQAERRVNPETLLDRTVRSYCFELRDRAGLGRAARGAPPALILFQSPTPTIEARHVQSFSFSAFLERFILPFSNRPAGYLQVRSSPPAGEVRLGRDTRGFTNKLFVVSTGEIEVVISWRDRSTRCVEKALIEPDKTATVECNQ
jgi:hypothetical protein